MLKSILTAAAFAALVAPAASANGAHHTTSFTKKATPVVVVSPRAVRNARNIRNVRAITTIKVSPFVSIAVPRVIVAKPVIRAVATPRRKIITKDRAVPVRATRTIRR